MGQEHDERGGYVGAWVYVRKGRGGAEKRISGKGRRDAEARGKNSNRPGFESGEVTTKR